jgi:CheY-like chemotaxis protein
MAAGDDPVVIVLAEDDDDDVLLTRQALKETGFGNPLVHVRDGEELLAFLRRTRRERQAGARGAAVLVLLDLSMPRMDGREALAAIQADSSLRSIPVVVLTTSAADEDVVLAYALGASAFIQKPADFEQLVEALRTIGHYWFDLVQFPLGC